jgi:hypothetical protein
MTPSARLVPAAVGEPVMVRRQGTVKAMGLFTVMTVLCGCTSVTPRLANIGIRPDDAQFRAEDSPCQRFDGLVQYSQDLQEAYHSRASQNRWWIYVAGTLALGTAAATGGLAAAGAATLTISLLSISGGFASGFFGFLNNSTLADVYTIAANQVAEALDTAQRQLTYSGAIVNEASCVTALNTLQAEVTQAQTDLERARTDSAVAALLRAKDQRKQLDRLLSELEPNAPRSTPAGGQITAIRGPEAGRVELTVSGIDLSKLQQRDVRVKVGETEVPVLGWTRDPAGEGYVVTFALPPKLPGEASEQAVTLVHRRAGATVESKPGLRLKRE